MTDARIVLSEQDLHTLEGLYPDRCPDMSLPDRMVWFKAGQASVVSYLKAQRQKSLEK